MAELKGNKRTLSINLSFFTPNDHIETNNENSLAKSSNKFEGPNGVVGLGIVAVMNQLDQALYPYFTPEAPILAVSPRSSPIPVCGSGSTKSGTKLGSSLGEMELSEEYTCVISHIGNNLIKKREYFDGDSCKKSESYVTATS